MAKERPGKQTGATISLRPEVLYPASLERITEADEALECGHFALSMYLSGLAVECVLQAIAIRGGAAHDAKHDLIKWLKKCPEKLKRTINARVADDWSTIYAAWNNRLRYLSDSGLLGYLRRKGLTKGIKGRPESVLKENAKRLLASAQAVHKKGVIIYGLQPKTN